MKNLNDYTEKKQTELFDELGVFFAFNDEQFEEGREKTKHLLKGKKYTDFGAGMFLPTVNVDEFVERHNKLIKEAQAEYVAEYGASKIIRYELENHEMQYSHDGIADQNFQNAIKGYGFTKEQVEEEYKKFIDHCVENDLI